jgi:hypothetical protein
MSLRETINYLQHLCNNISNDLSKVTRSNKTAAQRVRTSTVKFEKMAKIFRKESVKAERSGQFNKHPVTSRKKTRGSQARKRSYRK